MADKLVFIDDEPDLCDLYVALFSDESTEIKAFTDPFEAVDYIADNEVTMCFIDYRMPKINGVQLRKKLSQDLPCILLTGEIKKPDHDGFVAVLNKPLTEVSFREVLHKRS